MGNSVTKLTPCLAGGGAEKGPEIRRRRPTADIACDPFSDDASIGHSFSFVHPESSQNCSDEPPGSTFPAIHGISLSANQSTPSSLITDLSSSSSSFDSSKSFSSFLLHPSSSSFSSASSASHSGVLQRSDSQILAEIRAVRSRRRRQTEKPSFLRRLTNSISSRFKKCKGYGSTNSIDNETHTLNPASSIQSAVHWAQGKAGEDRVHVVVSEEHGFVFVGIYDGFNGPDAPDFLLSNLYPAILHELEEIIQWDHQSVLRAMSRALRRMDEVYLRMGDANPELAMIGSCVLAVLMRGEDVYLMNVGDSRAVLAQKAEPDLTDVLGIAGQNLERFQSEMMRQMKAYDRDHVSRLDAVQLTKDHSTTVYEEVKRIRQEHPDDPCVIVNGRVKGSLMVTRAFGAGFLKQPKWNRAVLEVFRVEYVGTAPYVTCTPHVRHHRLGHKDRFLILSSDGLYQFLTNQEVVDQVEMAAQHPEADPVQCLVEEILRRAACNAGMELNDLVEMPPGDRRKYHDDVSIVVIALDGRRIWRSLVQLQENE